MLSDACIIYVLEYNNIAFLTSFLSDPDMLRSVIHWKNIIA